MLTKEQLSQIQFTNLVAKTHYSMPFGVGKVKDQISTAVKKGLHGIAIVDDFCMNGILEAYSLSKDKDFLSKLKKDKFPIILGTKINLTDNLETQDSSLFNITLYASSWQGYKNMTYLTSLSSMPGNGFLNHDDNLVKRISFENLAERSEGLIIGSGDIDGILAQSIIKGTGQEEDLVQIFKEIFGDNFFIEIHYHPKSKFWNSTSKTYEDQGEDIQKIVNLELMRLAKKYDIKCCIVQNSYMHDKKYDYIQNILIANNKGFKGTNFYFDIPKYQMGVEEMYEYIQKNSPYITDEQFLEFCENTNIFVDKCKDIYLEFEPALPKIEYDKHPVNIPENYSQFESLYNETWKKIDLISPSMGEIFKIAKIRKDIALETTLKAMIRLGKMRWDDKEYLDRLALEMKVLARNGVLNLLDYFLLLEDVTNFVRDNGYLRGFGRGCVSEETLVLTKNNGYKKISEIKVGDFVFSHTGKAREVLKTFKYKTKPNEKLLEIITEGKLNPIQLTKDHKVYGIKREETNQYKKYKGFNKNKVRRYKDFNVKDLSFDKVENFKEGDLLFVKLPKRKIVDIKRIDLSKTGYYNNIKNEYDIFKNKIVRKRDGHSFNRYIDFNEEFAYVIGQFIGDGFYRFGRRNSVHIDFTYTDQKGVKLIKSFFKKLGINVTSRDMVSTVDPNRFGRTIVNINNKLIAKTFKDFFPKYLKTSQTKYIGNFKYLPFNKLKALIKGYMSADGYYTEKNGVRSERSITTSPQLRDDLKECFTYLNIPASVRTKKAFVDSRGYKNSEAYVFNFLDISLPRKNQLYKIQKDGYFVKIIEINEIKAPKYVYDLNVELDNSFLTSEYVIHNSGGGSLLTYVMDVSDVEPIQYKLLFERFFTQDRIGQQFHEVKNYPIKQFSKKAYEGIDSIVEDFNNLSNLFNKEKIKKVNKEFLDKELYYIECNENHIDYYKNLHKEFSEKNIKVENDNDSSLWYILDLTDQAPKKFIKHSEPTMPDFDYDTDGRDAIKHYLTEKNGIKHVTLIGTLGALKTKGAVKDIIRQLKPNMDVRTEVDPLTKKFDVKIKNSNDEEGIKNALETAKIEKGRDYSFLGGYNSEVAYFYACLESEPSLYEWFDKNQNVKDAVLLLLGNAKTTSVHAGGIVVSRKEIMELCPMTWSFDENVWVTQYEMKYVEKAGLIKYDFLGLKTLEDFNLCLKLIKQRHGLDLKLSEIPMTDPEVFKLFALGKTESVFQFNTDLPVSLLKQLNSIESIADLAIITALLRPGPMKMGMHNQFVKLKNKEVEPTYLHPALEDIWKETYSLCAFQETVIQTVKKIGKFAPDTSVAIMKALSKKDKEKVAKFEKIFVDNAMAKFGMTKEKAEEIWQYLFAFSEYGFNASHSFAYCCVSYLCMWFKLYYPAEWISAVLSGAKKEDLEILYPKWKDYIVPPSINQSKEIFQINNDNKAVMPFSAVNGVGDKAVAEIIKCQPYSSFQDFMDRVNTTVVNKGPTLALIFSGIFDEFKPEAESVQRWRKTLVIEYFKIKFTKSKASKKDKEEAQIFCKDVVNMNRGQILMKEISLLNFTAFDYYEYYKDKMTDGAKQVFGRSAVRPEDVNNYPTDTYVVVGGMVEDIEFKRNKKGEEWAIVKLSNNGTTISVQIFARQLADDDKSDSKFIRNLQKYMPVIFRGKVNRWEGRLSVVYSPEMHNNIPGGLLLF